MNQQVQDYFYNLYHFSKKFKTPLTFKYLFEYGKKGKMFDDDDFYDKNFDYPEKPLKYKHIRRISD